MSKTVFVIFGMTGAGKSSVISKVEKSTGLRRLKTTTTRPQRNAQDNEYNFTTNEQFLANENRYVAVRKYNALLEGAPKDYYYGVDKFEVAKGGLMITDFDGLKDLSKYDENIVAVYIYADEKTRRERAMARPGFVPAEYERRDKDDAEKFKLTDIVEFGKSHLVYIVDNSADANLDDVCDKVEAIILNHK